MDKAVSAVFAALIWHTQEIRQDLTPFGAMPLLHHHNHHTLKKKFFSSVACASEGGGEAGEPTLTPGLLSAFKAAESMRRELVSQSTRRLCSYNFLCSRLRQSRS